MTKMIEEGRHEHGQGQPTCELCGDTGVMNIHGRCHPTAPLRMEIDENAILSIFCYVPECNRLIARARLSEDQSGLQDPPEDVPDEWKIEFAPGALEDLDKIPEEDAQEILRQLQEWAEDGSLPQRATKVDVDRLMREDPELYERITGKKIEGH